MLDGILTRCGNALLATALIALCQPGRAAAQDVPADGDAAAPAKSGRISIEYTATAVVQSFGNLSTVPARFETGLIEIGDAKSGAVTLAHTGAAEAPPIVIGSVRLIGKNAAEYAIDIADGFTLYPGNEQSVGITFTPSSPGPKSARLQFDIEGATAPHVVFLGGESRYPLVSELAIEAELVDFGQIVVGAEKLEVLRLTNTGDAGAPAVYASSVQLGGDNPDAFRVEFAPTSILPGESAELPVVLGSAQEGTKNAVLEIVHDGNNETLEVVLRGVVVKPSAVPVSFGQSVLASPLQVTRGTALQFGPDGKLYVGELSGRIHVLNVTRNGKNDYAATLLQTTDLIKDVPNHDDDGTPNNGLGKRQMTGMFVGGTAGAPEIWAVSSDPRMGGGPGSTDLGMDTNGGILHRLVKAGGGWQKQDVVRGLPKSKENHAPNGIVEQGGKVYVIAGGHTNMGRPSQNFVRASEYALSSAVLEIDVASIGTGTYDLPTLDDEDRPGAIDANDPFGGNDGKNQAKLVAGGPVGVYSTGLRNAYDIVLTESGRLYTFDNGPNATWGDVPGPGCDNSYKDGGGQTTSDGLHLLARGSYAGHPNPVRGSKANTFNASNPQSPIEVAADPIECTYLFPGSDGSLTTIAASTNGMDEYTASNFGSSMSGNLLAVSFAKQVWRLQLTGDGTALTSKSVIASGFGTTPLDVTTQGDAGPFPGTIWVLDNIGPQITILEPDDY